MSGGVFQGFPFLQIPTKPKVFVSYHHDGDQYWYNHFNQLLTGTYDLVTDRSLDSPFNSDNPEYVERQIREKHISGTSCTIVLCGAATPSRKFVDWEICATLNKQHGLLGIVLPSLQPNYNNKYIVPDRLHANIVTGYAHWMHWTTDAGALRGAIDQARSLAQYGSRIDNGQPKMQRNR